MQESNLSSTETNITEEHDTCDTSIVNITEGI